MMRTILVPVAQDFDSEPGLNAALFIARHMNSHIRAMFVRPDADAVLGQFPEEISRLSRKEIELDGHRKAEEARKRFTKWRIHNHVPAGLEEGRDTCSAMWSEQVGEIEPIVTRFGRVSDLIVLPRPVSVSSQRAFDTAVFGTGRPTLLVAGKPLQDMTDHIMIAWNGSLEATRAVAGAMPLLHMAKRVSIFTALNFDDEAGDLGDLGEALSWHGIRTPEVFFPKNDQQTGSALLAAANKQGATMIVMGAYTHSRMRQAFLGGVTRQVLADGTIPVLMSH